MHISIVQHMVSRERRGACLGAQYEYGFSARAVAYTVRRPPTGGSAYNGNFSCLNYLLVRMQLQFWGSKIWNEMPQIFGPPRATTAHYSHRVLTLLPFAASRAVSAHSRGKRRDHSPHPYRDPVASRVSLAQQNQEGAKPPLRSPFRSSRG
jgi:hypothetical protein